MEYYSTTQHYAMVMSGIMRTTAPSFRQTNAERKVNDLKKSRASFKMPRQQQGTGTEL